MAPQSVSSRVVNDLQRLPGRTPLRVKLVAVMLALVAAALAAISIASISVLGSYLLGPVNNGLRSVASQGQYYRAVQDCVVDSAQCGVPAQGGAIDWVPARGQLRQVAVPVSERLGLPNTFGQNPVTQLPGPRVPANPQWLAANASRPVTVPAQSGSHRWRIIAYPMTVTGLNGQQVSGTVVVGVDVTSIYGTIGKLVSIDLVVSLIVLAALAVAGVAAVRASLRPLTDIEQTAQAIAAGDLSRRVPDRDPRTEVGRLGRSLNTMLSQIENAFHARAQSEAAARQSEDRMRRFIADASHELRTPLTAIRGYAEYYRQRGGVANGHAGGGPAEVLTGDSGAISGADMNRIMDRVEQESARMGVLVEDLLLLARLDQQRPLERKPVDLLTLAADAVQDARMVAPDRPVDLTVGAGTAFLVLGDEVRLRQVIGNLMSNALTHTPEGCPVHVRLSTAPGTAAAPSPAVALEVADEGPGMVPEQAERVFERFYRADAARTRKRGGSGLGLAIVAALVAAHGGAVTVDTAPGRGATFRVTLPLAPEAQHN